MSDFEKWEEETKNIDVRVDFRDKTCDAFVEKHIAPHLRRHAADVTRQEWYSEVHLDSDNMAFEAAMKHRYGDTKE